MLESLTIDDFKRVLGDAFSVPVNESDVATFELSDVTALGVACFAAKKREAFSLVFHGPKQPVFAQQLFRLRHPDLGELEMFLVPLGPDAKGMRYEAVFT